MRDLTSKLMGKKKKKKRMYNRKNSVEETRRDERTGHTTYIWQP